MVSPTGPLKGKPFIRQTPSGFSVKFGKKWSVVPRTTKATDVKSVMKLCNKIMKSKDSTAAFHRLTDLHHHLEQLSRTNLSEKDLQQVREAKKVVQSLSLATLAGEKGVVDLDNMKALLTSLKGLPEEKRSEPARNALSVFLDGILAGAYGKKPIDAFAIAEKFLKFCSKDTTVLSKMCVTEMKYTRNIEFPNQLSHMSRLLNSIANAPPEERFNISRNTLSPLLNNILLERYGRETDKAFNIAKGFLHFCPDDADVLSKMCVVEMKHKGKAEIPHMSRLLNSISNAPPEERFSLSRDALSDFLLGIFQGKYGDKAETAIAVAKGLFHFCRNDSSISERMKLVKDQFNLPEEVEVKAPTTKPPKAKAPTVEGPDPLKHMKAKLGSTIQKVILKTFPARASKALSPFLDEILSGKHGDNPVEAIAIAEEFLKFCPDDPAILAKMCAIKVKYSDEPLKEVLEKNIPKTSDGKLDEEIMFQGFNNFLEMILDNVQGKRFGERIVSLVDKMNMWKQEFDITSPVLRDIKRVQSTINSLLEKGDGFTVPHMFSEQPIVFSEDEKERDEKVKSAITNTFGRTTVFKGDEKIASKYPEDQEANALFFQEQLSEFYKDKNVPDPKKLAQHLMLKIANEYTFITNLQQLVWLDPGGYNFTIKFPAPKDPSFHFAFENSMAIVSQTLVYEKQGLEVEPELFDVTRSISLDPNNITSEWEEVITITPIKPEPTEVA